MRSVALANFRQADKYFSDKVVLAKPYEALTRRLV
jgi:hypothetical protein